jgi:hypothetical protein
LWRIYLQERRRKHKEISDGHFDGLDFSKASSKQGGNKRVRISVKN